jgi:hypothetical protein
LRVTINGSGAIVTHGDSLSGGGVIEFPINEPPEFVLRRSSNVHRDRLRSVSEAQVPGPRDRGRNPDEHGRAGAEHRRRERERRGHHRRYGQPRDRDPCRGGDGRRRDGRVLLPVIFAATDPGAVGAGQLWLFVDTNVADHANQYQLFIRNADRQQLAADRRGRYRGRDRRHRRWAANAEAWYARSVLTVRGRTGSGGGRARTRWVRCLRRGRLDRRRSCLIRDDGLVSLEQHQRHDRRSAAGSVPIMLDATAGTASIGLPDNRARSSST